jgi:hypothetical protein
VTGVQTCALPISPVKLGEGDLVLLVRAAKQQLAVVLRRTGGGDYLASQLVR